MKIEILNAALTPSRTHHPSPDKAADSAPSGPRPGSFEPSGSAEQDWMSLLMASPLFKQINDLDTLLSKAQTQTGQGGNAPASSDIIYGGFFILLMNHAKMFFS